MPNTLSCEHALTADGWIPDARISWDDRGLISAIEPHGSERGDGGLALPGLPDAHSHAFQHALVGHGEQRAGEDSFWSWREAMYQLAARITPEETREVARRCYRGLLAAGYTSVAEFHYLHHEVDAGRSLAMAEAVVSAARDVGIRITLLPVAYLAGGFGVAPQEGQRRFLHRDLDDFMHTVDQLRALRCGMGVAAHSLRAVPAETLRDLVTAARDLLGEDCPLHLHVAEQTAEVEDCLAHHGRRPIELLADSVELDQHWNLVHATHAQPHELELIARAGARVVVCPLTEAYLGDGLFPAVDFRALGGEVAIGSDCNVRLDGIEELRWLEYGQRLRDRKRARLADGEGLGTTLWSQVAAAGGAAMAPCPVSRSGVLAVGSPADIVVVPHTHGDPDRSMDALITAGDARAISAVRVAGRVPAMEES